MEFGLHSCDRGSVSGRATLFPIARRQETL